MLELSLAPQRVAIELNGQVARRDEWAQTVLRENDRVEIVHFVGGGAIDENKERNFASAPAWV